MTATLHEAPDVCAITGSLVKYATMALAEAADAANVVGNNPRVVTIAPTEARDIAAIQGSVAFLTTATMALVEASDTGQQSSLATIAPNTARRLSKYGNPDPQFNSGFFLSYYILDYSGTAIDTVANRICLFGGGHGPSEETDIRIFDLTTLQWSSLYQSTATSAMVAANYDLDKGRWISSNQPTARHSYNNLVVRGRRLYMMQWMGMPYDIPDSLTWGGRLCWYDFDAGTWTYSQVSEVNTPWYYGGTAAALDPTSQKILLTGPAHSGGGAANLWLYDPVADSIATGPATIIPSSPALVYFPPNDKFYALQSNGDVWEIVLNRTTFASSTFTQLTTTGTKPSSAQTDVCGYAYDSINQLIGGNPVGGQFYAFDPIARAWSAKTIQLEAGSFGAPQMRYHAIEFDQPSGCYVFLQYTTDGTSTNAVTWAYCWDRPSLSVTLDFGGGSIAHFAQANALDKGDYVGEYVHQRSFLAADPAFPDWRVWFRPDSDGSRDEVIVEFGRSTSATSAHWLTSYTATITRGAATIYSTTVPRHMYYGRWRYQSAPRAVVRNAALLKSRAWIPNLGTTGLYGGSANTFNTPWGGPMLNPTQSGDAFNPYMEQGGDHDEIGYLTEQGASYMIFGAAANLTTLRTQGEWCGNWCMHIRDDATGAMPSFRDTTTFFKDNGGTINGEMTDPFTSPTSSFVKVQAAHWYACANAAWLLTDDPFMLEELQFGVNWRMLWNKSPRVSQNLGGLMYPGETRAFAWGLRDMFLLAASTPVSTPAWLRPRSHWQNCLDDNLTFAMRYVNSPARMHSLFKLWTSTPTTGSWTQAWLTAEVGFGVEMGFSTWGAVFDWAIDGQMNLVNGTSGWNKQWPAPYKACSMSNETTFQSYAYNPYPVLNTAYDFATCTSWADLWAFYKTGGNGHTDDNGHTISDAYEATWDGHTLMAQFYQVQPPGGFAGYNVYYLHFRSAIVQAVRRGTAGAQTAYSYLQGEMTTAFSHYGGGPAIFGEARFSVDPS